MAPRKLGNSSAGEPLFSPGGNGARNPGSGFSYYIGDLFSTFSKHISPAFHHERPDRSVQMRLYTMHKGQHLLIFIMFLCLFFIAVPMGLAGPSMTMKFVMQASKTHTVPIFWFGGVKTSFRIGAISEGLFGPSFVEFDQNRAQIFEKLGFAGIHSYCLI